MKQPDPTRRPIPPARSERLRPAVPVGRFVASGATLVLVLVGCGRSAPIDALSNSGGDPDIAGVSITSPDAVAETSSTTAGEPTTSVTEAAPQQVLYTIQPGDTLSVIADLYNVGTDELAAYNGITDVNSIAPGQELAIPPSAVEPTEPAPADDTTDTTGTAETTDTTAAG